MSGQLETTFELSDLGIFDDAHLREIIAPASGAVPPDVAGRALADDNSHDRCKQVELDRLAARIERVLPPRERFAFGRARFLPTTLQACAEARSATLDRLFWDFTYWKTPEEYERLTAGEQVHLGGLDVAQVDNAVVLDAGAGAGRTTLPLARRARHVYAMDPAPPMLRLLEGKLLDAGFCNVELLRGTFARIPLSDDSVDAVVACSAFGPLEVRGGVAGLDELKRVTRPGGRIVIMWPEDTAWFVTHGFQHIILPGHLTITFPTLEDGLHVARRFYGSTIVDYLEETGTPELPFSVLGVEEPLGCCWMTVPK